MLTGDENEKAISLLFQVLSALTHHLTGIFICKIQKKSYVNKSPVNIQGKVTSDLIRSLLTLIFLKGQTLLSLETLKQD